MSEAETGLAVPAYKLFSPNSVWLASFVGSPLAGVHLIAKNYWRLGNRRAAYWAALCGAAIAAYFVWSAIAIATAVPNSRDKEDTSPYPIAMLMVVITGVTAKSLQGNVIQQHRLAGGKLARSGLLIGLIWLLAVAIVLLGIPLGITMFQLSTQRDTVQIGNMKVNINYVGLASHEARRFGHAFLQSDLVPENGETTVFVTRTPEETIITISLSDEAWKSPDVEPYVAKVVRPAALAIGQLPVTLLLVDKDRNVKVKCQIR